MPDPRFRDQAPVSFLGAAKRRTPTSPTSSAIPGSQSDVQDLQQSLSWLRGLGDTFKTISVNSTTELFPHLFDWQSKLQQPVEAAVKECQRFAWVMEATAKSHMELGKERETLLRELPETKEELERCKSTGRSETLRLINRGITRRSSSNTTRTFVL